MSKTALKGKQSAMSNRKDESVAEPPKLESKLSEKDLLASVASVKSLASVPTEGELRARSFCDSFLIKPKDI